jgi:protein-tyrosine-phosphatase/DNA-binding transcriptional ArsR family regulator
VQEAALSSGRLPVVLGLAAHPVRWRLLTELSRGDRRVRELTSSLGAPQPLVSYHLGRLRAAGLVGSRRSSFDARDAYYSLDLERYGELVAEAGGALHPGLRLEPTGSTGVARGARPPRVLFLCTGNSARSQMAEALVHELSGGAVEARSAGSRPRPLHSSAVRVLAARGIDVSGAASKHLDRFARTRFDCVVSLCDRVREVCPELPGEPETIHWSIPDPAAVTGGAAETDAAFERTCASLETRIRFLLPLLAEKPPSKGASLR